MEIVIYDHKQLYYIMQIYGDKYKIDDIITLEEILTAYDKNPNDDARSEYCGMIADVMETDEFAVFLNEHNYMTPIYRAMLDLDIKKYDRENQKYKNIIERKERINRIINNF